MDRYFGFLILLMSTVLAHGQSSLTLKQAINLAYQYNPTLKAQMAIVEQARGQFMQAGLFPNPSVAVQAENIGTPSTLESGYTGTDKTVLIEQPIPLGNRLHYMSQASKMEFLAACLKLDATRSNLYIDVGNAYVDAYYAQYWTNASKRLVTLNELVVSSTKKRLDIGANSEVDLKLAEIALDEAVIVYHKARRSELKTKTVLANIIGAPDLREATLNEHGFSHHLDTWSMIKKRLLSSNLIKAQMALIRAMQSRITATAKQVWPDLNLQLGFRHFELNDQKAAVVSASVPIPVFNQNQGNVYSAMAKRNEAIEDLHQLKLNLESTLYGTFLDAKQSEEEVQKVTQRMLPNAKKSVELAREGFEQGRYNYLILNNAMIILNREEEHYTRAHSDYHKAIIKIEGLLMNNTVQK